MQLIQKFQHLKEVETSKPIPTTPQKSEATTLTKEKNDKVLKSENEPQS